MGRVDNSRFACRLFYMVDALLHDRVCEWKFDSDTVDSYVARVMNGNRW